MNRSRSSQPAARKRICTRSTKNETTAKLPNAHRLTTPSSERCLLDYQINLSERIEQLLSANIQIGPVSLVLPQRVTVAVSKGIGGKVAYLNYVSKYRADKVTVIMTANPHLWMRAREWVNKNVFSERAPTRQFVISNETYFKQFKEFNLSFGGHPSRASKTAFATAISSWLTDGFNNHKEIIISTRLFPLTDRRSFLDFHPDDEEYSRIDHFRKCLGWFPYNFGAQLDIIIDAPKLYPGAECNFLARYCGKNLNRVIRISGNPLILDQKKNEWLPSLANGGREMLTPRCKTDCSLSNVVGAYCHYFESACRRSLTITDEDIHFKCSLNFKTIYYISINDKEPKVDLSTSSFLKRFIQLAKTNPIWCETVPEKHHDANENDIDQFCFMARCLDKNCGAQLTCGICYEQYSLTFKFHDCTHQACMKCAGSTLFHASVRRQPTTCPFCRTNVTSDTLRSNLLSAFQIIKFPASHNNSGMAEILIVENSAKDTDCEKEQICKLVQELKSETTRNVVRHNESNSASRRLLKPVESIEFDTLIVSSNLTGEFAASLLRRYSRPWNKPINLIIIGDIMDFLNKIFYTH